MERCIFLGMQILTENRWEKNQAVVVERGVIKTIMSHTMIEHHLPAKLYKYTENHYLIPGLIDLHIHGTHGKDVMDASESAYKTISRSLATEGVTGFLATTMTAGDEQIEKVLKTIASMPPYEDGAAMLGVHLEGPFISKSKLGAQSGQFAQEPNLKLMQHWQEVAQGKIKIVTLAPELPGILPLIKELRKSGVIVSIGHTNATYQETCAAIAEGSSQATHLFNAMRGLHQREPGAVGALLLSADVMAELIVDGIHLHPAIVALVYQIKGNKRLMLVTDALRAKCLGEGQHDLGGQNITVLAGKATLSNGTIAGSVLSMPQAIKNMMSFTQCSLIEAINMACETPAKALNLLDRKGSIFVGKDADLVVMNSNLDVMLTMRGGREVYKT